MYHKDVCNALKCNSIKCNSLIFYYLNIVNNISYLVYFVNMLENIIVCSIRVVESNSVYKSTDFMCPNKLIFLNILCLNRHTVIQIMKSHCISISCTLHNRNYTNFILMFTFCSRNCGQMHTVGQTQYSKTICIYCR